MKNIILLLFVGVTFLAQAQYTQVINSNRPGFSESPYSVGIGVYQGEAGLFYSKISESDLASSNSLGMGLSFRASFLSEKLEFSLNTNLQRDKINKISSFGFSTFTVGAKYLIYQPTYTDKSKEIRSWKKRISFDWKRLIPHIALYAGLNVGSFVNKIHKRDNFSPKLGVLLQNNFSSNFNLITNFYYDYIASDKPEYSIISTGTYNFDIRWSCFLEGQIAFDKQDTMSNLGLGVAYLYTADLQLDFSVRSLFQSGSTGFYTGLGISYRIDRHKDIINPDDSQPGQKLKIKPRGRSKKRRPKEEKPK